MSNKRIRRKISNFIIDFRSFYRLSIPFLTLAFISIGIVFMIHKKVLNALEHTELHGTENIETMNQLHEMQASVTRIGTYGLVFLGGACLCLWIVFSHRIFGPTVPIRRHIQNLLAGKYDSRIHLRWGDEFKGIAKDLNLLAESLERKKR